MGLLDILSIGQAGLGALADVWGRKTAWDNVQDYYHPTPGTNGTLTTSDAESQNYDPLFSNDPNNPNRQLISDQILGTTQRTPGQWGAVEQQAENQRVLGQQRQYATMARSDIVGSPLQTAADDLQRRIKGGSLAIDQPTMDRIVGRLIDQANASAGTERGQVQQSLARSGAGPGATAQANLVSDLGNAAALEDAQRAALIDRERINSAYGLQLDQLGAQVGGELADRLAYADYMIGSTYQPVDFEHLADRDAAFRLAGLNAENEALTGIANSGQASFQAGMGNLTSNIASRRIADASQQSPWGSPQQMISGALSGGVAGAMTGNPLAMFGGAAMGGVGGAVNNPYLGTLAAYGVGGIPGAGGGLLPGEYQWGNPFSQFSPSYAPLLPHF